MWQSKVVWGRGLAFGEGAILSMSFRCCLAHTKHSLVLDYLFFFFVYIVILFIYFFYFLYRVKRPSRGVRQVIHIQTWALRSEEPFSGSTISIMGRGDPSFPHAALHFSPYSRSLQVEKAHGFSTGLSSIALGVALVTRRLTSEVVGGTVTGLGRSVP